MYNNNMASTNSCNNQVMEWFAKYYDDTLFEEFMEDGTENGFFDIDKQNLKEFGIYGGGNRFWFDTRDGVIHILNRQGSRYGIRFHLEDEKQSVIKLCDKEVIYNDIIQYKKFYADLGISLILSKSGQKAYANPTEFYFGYKLPIAVGNGDIINFKLVCKVTPADTKNPVNFSFSFSSDFDFDGSFIWYANDNMLRPDKISLKANAEAVTIEKSLS